MKPVWQQLNDAEWTPAQHERVRERLVRHMQMVSGEETPSVSRWFSLPRWAPAMAAVVLVAVLGGSGTAVAFAQDSKPYESLYPVRVITERVRARLARTPARRAELAVAFSENRLAELRDLAEAQAASEGRARATIEISGDKRLNAFRRSGGAMKTFSKMAEKHIKRLRKDGAAARADELSTELDAVLDASLGILLSVETAAPAEEPVRAVVAKTKQEISPLESEIESGMNQEEVEAREKITAMPSRLNADGATQDTTVGMKERAEHKIDVARRALDKTEARLKEQREQYGDESVEFVMSAFDRAKKAVEKAASLYEAGDYEQAFVMAKDAARIAAHLKVYAPISGKRSKVQVLDDNQLRLHILPVYKDDFKPKEKKDK
ncbi:MAG: hypothetical protein HY437_00155 [Candidatus Magasanikbacteria bacterium]|nr:hypothetical protein [Candidatus Magasanikbacteria bacterium]